MHYELRIISALFLFLAATGYVAAQEETEEDTEFSKFRVGGYGEVVAADRKSVV